MHWHRCIDILKCIDRTIDLKAQRTLQWLHATCRTPGHWTIPQNILPPFAFFIAFVKKVMFSPHWSVCLSAQSLKMYSDGIFIFHNGITFRVKIVVHNVDNHWTNILFADLTNKKIVHIYMNNKNWLYIPFFLKSFVLCIIKNTECATSNAYCMSII